jgi:hypothetical protein
MRFAALFLVVMACTSNNDRNESQAQNRPRAMLTGNRPQRMRNCPSSVASATTTAVETVSGVDLVITSPDPGDRAELASRARRQATLGNPRWFMPPHTGMHGGPGAQGFCPVIHANTMVTWEPIPEGVRIHVAARGADQVTELQRATEARVRALKMLPPTS